MLIRFEIFWEFDDQLRQQPLITIALTSLVLISYINIFSLFQSVLRFGHVNSISDLIRIRMPL